MPSEKRQPQLIFKSSIRDIIGISLSLYLIGCQHTPQHEGSIFCISIHQISAYYVCLCVYTCAYRNRKKRYDVGQSLLVQEYVYACKFV